MRTKRYFVFTDQSKPSMAFFEAWIVVIKSGKIIGKPSMAINDGLLEAFEEMADMSVRVDEKPIDPIIAITRNCHKSLIRFPKNKI